jgi:hypothetical protein
MPPPSDPRNLRAKWQRALEERRKAGQAAPPLDVTPRPASRAEAKPPEHERTDGDAPTPEPERAGSDAPAPKPRMVTPEPEPERADGEEGERKKAAPQPSPWGSMVAALVLVGGVGFALRTFLGPDQDTPSPQEDDPPVPSVLEPPAPTDPSAKAPAKPRCAPPAKEPFLIGDAPAPKPTASANEGDDPHDDELAPFAVELGRGVRFDQGFAVGTQRQAEGGTVSMVALLGPEGGDGRLVRLARSRGDFDPPVVAAAGATLLAAMMEPNAGGRAIRIAKIEGDRVTWGPELAESNDESLALDIAVAGASAIAVWDDVPLGRERSVIELATFDLSSMRGSGARPVTPPQIDADVPRLAPRPGGFWLSYMVHGDPPTAPTAEKDDEPADAGDGAPSARGKGKGAANPDDSDTEAAGEAIAHQWIELVPLDQAGFPTAAPRAVTPKNTRVNGYDLGAGDDGRAVVLYREDDTPSGSSGGRVKALVAELGGATEEHVIAEDGVGTGVPLLHGGWVVIHSLSGPVQLGAIGPRGDLASELQPEASLKLGEILAANGDSFLVATPAGRAMKLGVVRCTR